MLLHVSAEEFFARRQAHLVTLDAAARTFAAHGDPVDALACAWGADLAAVQSVLWARIVVGSRTPLVRYYQAGEAVIRAVSQRGVDDDGYPDSSAEHIIVGARRRLLRAFEPRLSREIDAQLPSLGYLGAIVAPSREQFAASVTRRLLGLPWEAFVSSRRGDADMAMARARRLRDEGDLTGAVASAYDADSWALSAYLVESAMSVGDEDLLSVTTRWELVNAALEGLPSLPTDFDAAVGLLRATVMLELGEADGARWHRTLVEA